MTEHVRLSLDGADVALIGGSASAMRWSPKPEETEETP